MDFEYLDFCEDCGNELTLRERNDYITFCEKCNKKREDEE